MNPRRVKEGTWLYAGTAPAQVFIEEVDSIPGSGDYEDPEEVREDKVGRFFRVGYTAAGSTEVCSGGGYFASIEEAILQAEKACSGLKWSSSRPIQRATDNDRPAPGRV